MEKDAEQTDRAVALTLLLYYLSGARRRRLQLQQQQQARYARLPERGDHWRIQRGSVGGGGGEEAILKVSRTHCLFTGGERCVSRATYK